jgi:hypothetical protein
MYLNKFGRKFCFQLMEFDFVLDASMNPWLIGVNQNPSLEESCPFLQMLIPRMINDLFIRTVDLLFPIERQVEKEEAEEEGEKKSGKPDYSSYVSKQECMKYPVHNYADSENLWDPVS